MTIKINYALELINKHSTEFNKFRELLIKWNKTYNLTAITKPAEINEKHFLDSIACESLINKNARLLDVGCGGGFPGIPLKIVRPDLKITLLDATQKKCSFCRTVIRELNLQDIDVVCGRIEDKKVRASIGTFDTIISRATFSIADYLSNSLELLAYPNSTIIAMKSDDTKHEINEASKIIMNANLNIMQVEQFALPSSKSKRTIIVFGHY